MKEKKIDLAQLQKEIKQKKFKWRAGKTRFVELPMATFRRYLGLRLPDEKTRLEYRTKSRLVPAPRALPVAIDWRDHQTQNWITDIRDQGQCGSCVAFGTVAAMEAMWNILQKNPSADLDLSEAHLFFCGGSCGCSFGWLIPPAVEYATQHGVSVEKCFPYQDHDMACNLCADWMKQSYRIVKSKELVTALERKEWLAKYGPIIAAMDVYDDFMTYSGGVYQYVSGDLAGGHCISIVGYDDKQGCWICKNSWGTDWGEIGGLSTQRGWFRIAYGQCGIDADHPSYGMSEMAQGGKNDAVDHGTAPCCISAVATGTPFEKDLGLLRDFRDTHLAESETAKKYIDIYYRYTESFVEVLRSDPAAKKLAFSLLETAISAIRSLGNASATSTFMASSRDGPGRVCAVPGRAATN